MKKFDTKILLRSSGDEIRTLRTIQKLMKFKNFSAFLRHIFTEYIAKFTISK